MKAAFKKSTSGEVCGTIGYISDDGTPINFTVKGKGCRHGQKALALIAERDMKIFQSRVKKAAQIMSYLVK